MNKRVIIYLIIIIIFGVALLGYSLMNILYSDLVKLVYWLLLAGLCQSFVFVYSKDKSVSVVFSIIMASQLLGGTFFSTVVGTGSFLFYFHRVKSGVYEHLLNRPFFKTLFNMGNLSISCFLSGQLFEFMLSHFNNNFFVIYLFSLLIYIIAFHLLNSVILTTLMKFLYEQPFLNLWINGGLWGLINVVALAPLGFFFYQLYRLPSGPIYVLLLFGPLLLARYSFKLYLDSKAQYYKTIKTLTAAIEAKDEYTEGHSRRVETYAEKIAMAMKLPSSKIESIKVAAVLHDIGKIGIEDAILRKPDHLSDNEWNRIRQHPEIGVKILEDVEFPDNVKDFIKHHHEKYDGTGYPDGLKGDDVPLEAYILAAADAYDAMTSDRPYRKALPRPVAIERLNKDKGTHFHPDAAEMLIKILEDEEKEAAGEMNYAT